MKKEILRFWNNHASQYMWLHNKSETKYKMMDKVILLLNMIITSILGFYLIFDNKAISVGCFFSVMLSYNSLKNNYKTKSIYHNIAKKEYRLFLEDITKSLSSSSRVES